ncbi:sulfoxide reductase heme-binding subunit YedZ [Oceanimonas pelagia]|uniref:Protein-methionine-sulfoxide reductase heme-binding subunit MsrQ n=1 Tax=Oceanimonas pelagia TaxID=3028314 RepID=A0AA50KNN6_9GAMM|nr:protein-methionine-sulfoxide reductase heme-binding subunit MsrQ [Oceanimonas pelagia]WMC10265.1 sulfoxide reductase heme-binding subunit YedZ [Oceanimonas pelagia]
MRIDASALRRLRVLVHGLAVLPLLWLPWGFAAGHFSADPVPELLHYLGIWALRLLLLTLCISPLAKRFRLGPLVRLRRAVGLWCFAYASLHLLAWVLLDLQLAWGLIGEEIVKRGFITLGMAAWGVLLLLAITSTQGWQRRLGAHWQRLHNWIYPTVPVVCVHFWWSVKSGWIEPLAYLLAGLFLLLLRRDKLTRPWR